MTTSHTRARRPGRPPQTQEEQARARANIVRATSAVFAEHGYHGMSVARILQEAGIARPTFYRYFRNADEPLRLALREIGRALRDRVVADVRAADGEIAKLIGAIDAYLWWSGEHRDLLGSLYAGVHDAASPVSGLRPLTVNAMIDLLATEFVAAGRRPPARWLLDVYVNAVEYTCYQLHLNTPGGPDDVAAARQAMLKAGIALLGTPEDWTRFMQLPDMFDAPGLLSGPV